MTELRSSRLFAALLFALAAASGCADGDRAPPGTTSDGGGQSFDSGGGGGPDLKTDDAFSPNTSVLRVAVPQNLVGTARQLYAVTSATYPPAGPTTPLLTVDTPRLTPGLTYASPFDAKAIKGNLYVIVFLFMQGGGTQGQPKAGVDYAGNTPNPVTFDGTQQNVGPVMLQLVK